MVNVEMVREFVRACGEDPAKVRSFRFDAGRWIVTIERYQEDDQGRRYLVPGTNSAATEKVEIPVVVGP